MASKKEKTKEERIKIEDKRLRKIFEEIPGNVLELYDGLIHRAAYMRITLEDYEVDIDTNGYYEMFTQSERTDPYERERPAARLYNTMNKNYQSIMKQLADKLPEQTPADVADEIMKFVAGDRR